MLNYPWLDQLAATARDASDRWNYPRSDAAFMKLWAPHRSLSAHAPHGVCISRQDMSRETAVVAHEPA
jgi:hypothetical protein